jgi:hypothetical protein
MAMNKPVALPDVEPNAKRRNAEVIGIGDRLFVHVAFDFCRVQHGSELGRFDAETVNSRWFYASYLLGRTIGKRSPIRSFAFHPDEISPQQIAKANSTRRRSG